jgi:hypothetical protein
MGSKSELLRTLVAAESAKSAGFGVPSFVPKWRARNDSNVRPQIHEIAEGAAARIKLGESASWQNERTRRTGACLEPPVDVRPRGQRPNETRP